MNKKPDEMVEKVTNIKTEGGNSESYSGKSKVESHISTSLILPLEEYLSGAFTESLLLQQYKQTMFPDLFKPAEVDNDRESIVSVLASIKPMRLYADLKLISVEKKIRDIIDKNNLVN